MPSQSPMPGRPGGTTCPYGHGLMEKLEGWWSLSGVDVRKPVSQGLLIEPVTNVIRNGRAYTVRVWKCPVCGNVQLFDDVVN